MAGEAVAQQGQAIDAISRLTNALLDISKLESGAVRPDPADFGVAALFEELRSEFASVAASKGLELRIEAAAHSAHSDPSLVGQLVSTCMRARSVAIRTATAARLGSLWRRRLCLFALDRCTYKRHLLQDTTSSATIPREAASVRGSASPRNKRKPGRASRT